MSTAIYSDFRGQGHASTGHWNDPSDAIFKKPTHTTEERELEEQALLQHLQEYLLICKEQNPSQKRMLDDTEKRLNLLFDKLQNDTLSSSLLAQLEVMVKGMLRSNILFSQLATNSHTLQ
ncbi:protein transport protein S31, variant 2 [Basidiobolus ranarum]|uniref:Protein transport protein S31, variant 2 n=1 Tax=Basidiobolus ranarum TaxID=34480 RepID=A0ABR2W8H9_9FUNG